MWVGLSESHTQCTDTKFFAYQEKCESCVREASLNAWKLGLIWWSYHNFPPWDYFDGIGSGLFSVCLFCISFGPDVLYVPLLWCRPDGLKN